MQVGAIVSIQPDRDRAINLSGNSPFPLALAEYEVRSLSQASSFQAFVSEGATPCLEMPGKMRGKGITYALE